jgi:uncharacterized protein (DUF4415 family)
MRKEYDFSKAKRAYQVPHLAQLQTEYKNQSKIIMQVDNDILAIFKTYAQTNGANYQALMNEALRQFAQGLQLTQKNEVEKAI